MELASARHRVMREGPWQKGGGREGPGREDPKGRSKTPALPEGGLDRKRGKGDSGWKEGMSGKRINLKGSKETDRFPPSAGKTWYLNGAVREKGKTWPIKRRGGRVGGDEKKGETPFLTCAQLWGEQRQTGSWGGGGGVLKTKGRGTRRGTVYRERKG